MLSNLRVALQSNPIRFTNSKSHWGTIGDYFEAFWALELFEKDQNPYFEGHIPSAHNSSMKLTESSPPPKLNHFHFLWPPERYQSEMLIPWSLTVILMGHMPYFRRRTCSSLHSETRSLSSVFDHRDHIAYCIWYHFDHGQIIMNQFIVKECTDIIEHTPCISSWRGKHCDSEFI